MGSYPLDGGPGSGHWVEYEAPPPPEHHYTNPSTGITHVYELKTWPTGQPIYRITRRTVPTPE